ncbi:MAG: hypothetical protein HQ465_23945 [Rhodospirillales bacterium]|nr:hypothetical protein [Rhodospirillales bacterium]
MDDKLIIAATFHLFVGQGQNADGTDKPARRATYAKGMVIEAFEIPEGHTADDWVAKGLATAA